MLTLSLNNQQIPVPRDFSMRLTWKSPVCDFEKIPSGYGLGLSFPINEYTRSIFGNPERFTKYRAGNDQKFPGFEVRFGGVLLMAGTLSITSSSKEAYEATLIDQVGVLGEKEQERDILEFPEFAEEIPWENSADFSPDDSPYCCFPFRNPFFFKDKGFLVSTTDEENDNKEVELLRYVFNNSANSIINKLAPGGTVNLVTEPIEILGFQDYSYSLQTMSVVSPFFFLNYIIRKALKSNLFYLENTCLETDPVLKMLCIYNNFDITINSYDTSEEFETIVRVDYDDTGKAFAYHTTVSKQITSFTRTYGPTIVAKNHLPKLKLGELLASTQNLLNLVFFFKPNNTVDVLSREAIISGAAIDLDAYFLGQWAIDEKKKVALKFVWEPDDNDFIFSERFTDLSDRRADIKPSVALWDDLPFIINPTEGEIRFLEYHKVFAEYKWSTVSEKDPETLREFSKDVLGWTELSIGWQNGWYNYGREEIEEIKTAWSTCYGTWHFEVVTDRTTSVNQPGNMNTWKAKQQAFSPRLLLYNGNNSGTNENHELALDWEKPEKGILAKYWKLWNPFWANRLPVTGEFDLPVNMLRHLIYNICSKYRTREGEFLIEEMSCEIYIDRIGTTEIKGFKVE
jgi:hypothetical protein